MNKKAVRNPTASKKKTAGQEARGPYKLIQSRI